MDKLAGSVRRRKDAKRTLSTVEPSTSTVPQDEVLAALEGALWTSLRASGLGGGQALRLSWGAPPPLCASLPLSPFGSQLAGVVLQAMAHLQQVQAPVSAACLLQACLRRHLVLRRVALSSPACCRALSALVASERLYVFQLAAMVQDYLIPLRARSTSADEVQDIVTIFSNVEAVLQVHRSLLEGLEGVQQHPAYPRVQNVGILFLRLAQRLHIYGDYAENFVASKITLNSVLATKKSKLRDILEKRREDAPSLETVLFYPIKRIARYEALLDTLSDAVGEVDVQEQEMMERAKALVTNVRKLVNKKLEEAERSGEIQEVERLLVSEKPVSLRAEGRSVLGRGMLPCKKPLAYTLFNDALLLARPSSDNKQKLVVLANLRDVVLERQASGSKEVVELRVTSGEEEQAHAYKAEKAVEETQAIEQAVASYKKDGVVFGVDLQALLQKEGRDLASGGKGVPMVVDFLASWLRNNGLKTQGILRQPGTFGKIEALKKRLDNALLKSYDGIDLSAEDVHDVAGVLRHYCAALPEPLIPYSLYEPLMAIQRDSSLQLQGRVDAIAEVVQKIPATRVALLKYIIAFLQDIERHAQENKMSVVNLAICFSPNVLRPKVETIQNALEMPLLHGIVQILIEQGDVVFKPRRMRRRQSKLFTPSGRPLSTLFVGNMTQFDQGMSLQEQMQRMHEEAKRSPSASGSGLKLVDFSKPRTPEAGRQRAESRKVMPGGQLRGKSLAQAFANPQSRRGNFRETIRPSDSAQLPELLEKAAAEQRQQVQASLSPPSSSPRQLSSSLTSPRSESKRKKLAKGISISKLGKLVG